MASGTTSLLATVVFPEQKADNEILSVAKILQKRVQQKGIGAVIEGIHVEVSGVFSKGETINENRATEYDLA